MPDQPLLFVASDTAAAAARLLLPRYEVQVWHGLNGDASALTGRDILGWPDAGPDAGVWRDEFTAALQDIAQRVRVIDVSDQPTGWDAEVARDAGWIPSQTISWARQRLAPAPEPTAPEPAPPAPEPPEPVSRPTLTLSNGGAQPEPDPAIKAQALWFDNYTRYGLSTNTRGVPYMNIENVERLLNVHPSTRGRFWWDEFHCKAFTTWGVAQGDETIAPRELTDADILALTVWVQRDVGLYSIESGKVNDAIVKLAADNLRCEPKEWMQSLEWDREPRLTHFLYTYFGTPDTEYYQGAGRNFFRGMVARIFRPGCQLDNMLIFEGGQGTWKSTAMRVIGGPWHTESHEAVGSKDFSLALHGKLVVEISEMHSFSKAEIQRVKGIVTCQTDRYRPPYARRVGDYPRRSVFVGTTNEEAYLRDPSGARRWWPIRCGRIDPDALRRDRDQLFAEAVSEFIAGRAWWEMPEQETLEQQTAREVTDDWDTAVLRYINERETDHGWVPRDYALDRVTTGDLLNKCLGIPLGKVTQGDTVRMGNVVRRIKENGVGWKRRRDRKGEWAYYRPGSEAEAALPPQ